MEMSFYFRVCVSEGIVGEVVVEQHGAEPQTRTPGRVFDQSQFF